MHKALNILAALLLIALCSTMSFAAEAAEGSSETKAKTETITLDVTGMTCQGCVAKINKGLKGAGFNSCTADIKKKCIVVEVAKGTDVAKLIKSVEGSGFKAKKHEAKTEKKEEAAK